MTFSSPAAGTPLTAASPLAALDLALKVLTWADGGQTRPGANLAGMDPLTNAVVAI